MNQQVADLAARLDVRARDNAMSRQLLADAEKMKDRLASLRGADFDRAYSRNELEYHRTVNGVVEDAFIPNIETPEVREAFEAALITFRRHEERAARLVRSVQDGEGMERSETTAPASRSQDAHLRTRAASGEGARMTDLATLVDRVQSCTLCARHLPHGPRPILQIDPAARILVAGQAPGRRVHESGVPFDDPSGDRLRDWLGLTREQFYDPTVLAILPMGFCYPGTGSSGDLPPRPECAPAWREDLLGHLPDLALTLVIGRYALDWHLDAGRRTVTDVVRAWRDRWPDVVPLPHPSPRNRRWTRKNPWFEAEVLPALRGRVAEVLEERGSG